MATLALPQETPSEPGAKPSLKSLDQSNLGMYVPFEISDEEMYGPDELDPELLTAIKNIPETCGKYEDAARIWEVVQATEARLFDRGYQWLTNAKTGGGWNVAGTNGNEEGGGGSGAIVRQDKGRMWACNIYGARKDKIVSALTVKDPVPEFFPQTPGNSIDEKSAEQAGKYKHLWKQTNNVKNLCVKIAGLFYTDDRTAMITESVKFGDKIGEKTRASGKLEFRVPMSIDEDDPLPWCCRMREMDIASAKEKYEWIDTKITAGAGGRGQIDRTCRLTVRNAVQNQTQWTSNASDRAVTEETWWVRPSQFRDITDKGLRKQMRDMFPDGARVVFAGGEFAYIRNEKMDDCVVILYSREGTGQNRRAIGSNNLVTNKILNYDISLLNRYLTVCVPRKIHDQAKINSEAIAGQNQDPSKSTGVDTEGGTRPIEGMTGLEQVPQPPAQLMDFISSLTEGLPDILDGASPSMFGGTDGTDTATGITIQRDQALQVFGTPYNAMTWGIAISCNNARKWAGRTREGEASGMIPGVGRISVDFASLKGELYCFPEADSGFPESEAEKEARLEKFIDAGGMPTLIAAAGGPSNFEAINRVTKRFGVTVTGIKSVRKQEGEFEKLLKTLPMPNPAYFQAAAQVQQLTAQAQTEPDAQTPQGQQALQQVQSQLQSIPQLLTSVPVEQDSSVDHGIEAQICWDKMNSEDGQKLKREKPPIYQNLWLHWQGHDEMQKKLSPPPAMPEVRPSVTVAVDKLGANAQVAMLQKEYGITVAPEDVLPTTDVHEITEEKNGVDAGGVPVKQKVSYTGNPNP